MMFSLIDSGDLSQIALQVHEAARIRDMFSNMHRRCYDPKFESYCNYGARGIKVCSRWQYLDFFAMDIRKMLMEMNLPTLPKNFSLERLDANGHYDPSNCTLADNRTQARNRRNVVKVIFNGEEIALIDLCERYNADPEFVRRQVRKGVPLEEALTKPSKRNYQDYLLKLEEWRAKYPEKRDTANSRRRETYAQRRDELKKAS